MVDLTLKTQTTASQPASRLTPVRALAWKEWRENRTIVVGAVLLTFLCFLLPAIWLLVGRMHPDPHDTYLPMDVSGFVASVVCVLALMSVICGASIVSPEIGNGSLAFLSSLPMSRKRIWWTKVGMGLLVMLACMVAAPLTMLILCAIGIPLKVVTDWSLLPHMSPTDILTTALDFLEASLLFFGAGAALFSVGAVVTMMADRTVTGIIVSIVLAVAVYCWIAFLSAYVPMYLQAFWPSLRNRSDLVEIVFIAAAAIVFYSASYNLFVNGETLKTQKRFTILAGYLLPPVFILSALIIALIIILV